ncbi:MAG: hypothetical protein M1465_00725 [Candidatus Marsarchaeota archaeon]|nr:hypothetical protein [Candidatus Marsarchaeota archaeon]
MLNPIKRIRYWKLERFLEKDSANARPVVIVKERENVYRFVWADEMHR